MGKLLPTKGYTAHSLPVVTSGDSSAPDRLLHAIAVTIISAQGAEDWPRMSKDDVPKKLAVRIAEALGDA